jgi:Xaa-Pro aminopeptidase
MMPSRLSTAQQRDAAELGHPRSRLDRCRELLQENAVDALLVSDPVNVRYLTGYTGTNGHALVSSDAAWLLTDGRYQLAYADRLPRDWELVARDARTGTMVSQILRPAQGRTIRLGVEADHVTLATLDGWQRDWRQGSTDIEVVELAGAVAAVRRVKDAEEHQRLTRACALTHRVVEDVVRSGVAGLTEQQLTSELVARALRAGASGPAFPPVVANGHHSAEIHHEPGNSPIGEGLLLIDFGLVLDAYSSDLTRTFYLGTPTETHRARYEAVHQSQQSAARQVAAGSRGEEVDQVARATLAGLGFDQEFPHALGHGVGMTLSPCPLLGIGSKDVLVAGDAITIEPGIYESGWGGIRIEDCFAVTDNGAQLLGIAASDTLRTLPLTTAHRRQ